MKIQGKTLATGAMALLAVGASVVPAAARPLRNPVGSVQPKAQIVLPDFETKTGHGFPAWYADRDGLQLELCLDGPDLCTADGTLDLTRPAYVETLSAAERERLDADPEADYTLNPAASNFEHEHFWYTAAADVAPAGSPVTVSLEYAVEAAFANEEAVDGDQMTFGRTRIRLDNGAPGTDYTFVHPHGQIVLTADDRGQVRYTEDIGCTPGINALFNDAKRCDFGDALHAPLMRDFLTWDTFGTNAADAPPAGYIGDPTVPHAAVGGVNNAAKDAQGKSLVIVRGDLDLDDTPADDEASGDQWAISGKILGGGGNGGPGGGGEPPVVDPVPGAPTATFAPAGAALGRNQNVVVTFSEPVTGVDKNSFELTQGGRAVAATVTLSADGLTATLNPRNQLAAGTRYRAVLSDRIGDAAGNALTVVSKAYRTNG